MGLANTYFCIVLVVGCIAALPLFFQRKDRVASGARSAWMIVTGLGIGALGIKAWIGIKLQRLIHGEGIQHWDVNGELLGRYASLSASASVAFIAATAIGAYSYFKRVPLTYANPILNIVLGAVGMQSVLMWVALVLNPDSPHDYDSAYRLALCDAHGTYVRWAVGLAAITGFLFIIVLYRFSKHATPDAEVGAQVSIRDRMSVIILFGLMLIITGLMFSQSDITAASKIPEYCIRRRG